MCCLDGYLFKKILKLAFPYQIEQNGLITLFDNEFVINFHQQTFQFKSFSKELDHELLHALAESCIEHCCDNVPFNFIISDFQKYFILLNIASTIMIDRNVYYIVHQYFYDKEKYRITIIKEFMILAFINIFLPNFNKNIQTIEPLIKIINDFKFGIDITTHNDYFIIPIEILEIDFDYNYKIIKTYYEKIPSEFMTLQPLKNTLYEMEYSIISDVQRSKKIIDGFRLLYSYIRCFN